MYDYSEKGYFAQATGKMESLCGEELAELGAINIKPAYKGVYFNADIEIIYRINYTSRLLSRVLAPLSVFSLSYYKRSDSKSKRSIGRISFR